MRKTSINHQQFVEMWNNNVLAIKIAEEFGLSISRVSNYASEHRGECPRRKKSHNIRPGKIIHKEFVKLWNEGMTVNEIAKKFGVCKQRVSQYAKAHRDQCCKRRVGKKKLINHTEFVKQWNSNTPVAEMAKNFGTKKQYVSIYATLHKDECIVLLPHL